MQIHSNAKCWNYGKLKEVSYKKHLSRMLYLDLYNDETHYEKVQSTQSQ